MRILVAEDSPENRQLLVELLRSGGHSVKGVCNGREALDALERDPFDVVFLDDEMPVMNGIDVARAVRRRSLSGRQRHILIGVSGNTAEADERRFLAAGMDAFLPKPVGMAELLGLLAVLARHDGPARELLQAGSDPERSSQRGPAPLNLAAHLERATGGNQKLLRSLIKNFLADAPRKLAAVQRALRLRDPAALASAAHALSGAMGLFGADRAAAAARHLQVIGRAGGLAGSDPECRTLEEEFVRLRHELLALLEAPRSGRASAGADWRAPRPSRRRTKPRS